MIEWLNKEPIYTYAITELLNKKQSMKMKQRLHLTYANLCMRLMTMLNGKRLIAI